jgi:hypothetical protein
VEGVVVSIKVVKTIDENLSQLQNIKVDNVAGNPASPVESQLWYNTTTHKLMYRDNATSIDPLARANHSGTQLSTTISDLQCLQQVRASFTASSTTTALIPSDDTIPQNTEGTEFMTAAITPLLSTSVLLIEATAFASTAAANNIIGALFRDSTANAIFAAQARQPATTAVMQLVFQHWVASGSTAATTFRIRLGPQSADTLTFNGGNGSRLYGAIAKSTIVITEWRT